MIIGSHVGMKGKDMFLGSVKEAISYNSNAFMIYTGAPQNTRRKSIEEMNIEEAHKLMKENNIDINNVIVHAPYIMNFANPSDEKYDFAVNFFTEEVKRASALGVKQVVLHPGAHVGTGSEEGIKRIIRGVNDVISNTIDLDVKISLETMGGKGTECGRTFNELKSIIDGIDHKERISVCMDTCHLNDSGYDIVNDLEGVLKEFDEIIGLDLVAAVHLNDSKNPLGSNKDRHDNIGFGTIGFDTLLKVANHELLKDIPKILETPYVSTKDGGKDRTIAPYKFEIEMIKSGKFNPDLLNVIRLSYGR